MSQLGHIARKLLTQSERSGVLQVRPSDFDDGVERLRLRRQGVAQPHQRRQQPLGQACNRCEVHGGWKHVIRRLAAVNVIIWMHDALHAPHPTQQLTGPIGQDLIDIHIGLGAGARLPDYQRKLALVAPGKHFVCRLLNRSGLARIQFTQAWR